MCLQQCESAISLGDCENVKSSQRFVASSSIYCARSLAPVGAVSPSPLHPLLLCPLLIHSNSCCDIQTENIQVMTKLYTNLSSVSRNILVIMMVPISLITARAMMLLLFTMCQAQAQHWLWVHGCRFKIRTLHFAFLATTF